MWVLGTELWLSPRVSSAISPGPTLFHTLVSCVEEPYLSIDTIYYCLIIDIDTSLPAGQNKPPQMVSLIILEAKALRSRCWYGSC